MGIEYCLYKQVTFERYELGKTNCDGVFPITSINMRKSFLIKEEYKSYVYLYYRLLENVAFQYDLSMRLQYFFDLAKDIYIWCGDDLIEYWSEDYGFNEMFYDIRYMTLDEFSKRYPYTGSRFKLKEPI